MASNASLRNNLLRWLIPTYIAVAAITTVFAWVSGREMVSGFMNEQMEAFAKVSLGNRSHPLRAAADSEGAYEVVLWSKDGQLIEATHPGLPLNPLQQAGFSELESNGERWHVYTLATPEGTVQTLQRSVFRRDAIVELSNRTLLSLLLLIPLSSFIVWLAIRASLRPLDSIARSVSEQDVRTFSALPLAGVPAEIEPLVVAINSLLERLRKSFVAQQHFIHDAAHELRTPVAALSVQLQNLRDVLPAAAVGRVGSMEAGLQRAHRVLEQLLRLARADAGAGEEAVRELSLREQLRAAVTALLPLADQRHIDLGFHAGIEDACIVGHEHGLRSLLDNLLDNALRYSPRGAVVDARLAIIDGLVTVEILDAGPGIPEDQLSRVFDRFYRVVGTGVEGSGLGLAIAQGAAQRLQAELKLFNRPAGGLRALVRFPHARVVLSSG
ncbi:MAG: ATP-binding protein [Steroidobacteraceae bacterium]